MNNTVFFKRRKFGVYITHNSLYKSSLRLLILRGFIWDSLCLDVAFRLLFEVKQLCGHGGEKAAGEVIYVIPKARGSLIRLSAATWAVVVLRALVQIVLTCLQFAFATVKVKETQKIRCTEHFFKRMTASSSCSVVPRKLTYTHTRAS